MASSCLLAKVFADFLVGFVFAKFITLTAQQTI